LSKTILTGRKQIMNFVGRSWPTIQKWIDEDGFPARKLDGVWEADGDLVIEWRRRQIVKRSENKGHRT
jgi:hypothetical protein